MDGGAHDSPVSVELLADLQAGLLDPVTAARVRRRIRNDPTAAQRLDALRRVRRELAVLGTDAASAPDAPADVTVRIDAVLRAAPPPTSP